jgi:hypothetical protein
MITMTTDGGANPNPGPATEKARSEKAKNASHDGRTGYLTWYGKGILDF